MTEGSLTRVRITFSKGAALKYISHLDLLRVWERLLRRAALPVSYSQGFNPHPKITIAMPLPVGCTGEREVLDVVMDQALPAQHIVDVMQPVCPTGLGIVAVREVPLPEPALPGRIRRATYRVTLSGIESDGVAERAAELCAREEILVTFRRKTFDLRPLIESLTVEPVSPDPSETVLTAVLLRSESGRIGRPDVLVEALDLGLYLCGIHRCAIDFGPAS